MAFGLLALVSAPFVFAAPVYATDDNTIDIAVDSDATMERSGDLYKATTSVTVGTDKPYGFSLTMQASTPDLINAADPTRKISAPQSTVPTSLGANQWGYALDKSATTFSAVPADAQATPVSAQSGVQPATQLATSVVPAVIADVTKAKPAGCKNVKFCTKRVTFAANVAQDRLAAGAYSTAITYTATAKPGTGSGSGSESGSTPVVDPTVCKSGDPQNDCQVDLDANMIPVKYTGNTTHAEWTSLANPEDSSNQGDWYNYNNKQWANAITVEKEALAKYKGQTKVVEQSDILGFWVYIPRYAYEVMRRDGTDKPVPAQNFTIHFENKNNFKRYPIKCGSIGKDYRTQCGLDRNYTGSQRYNGTWATHPAFTFGKKELNGIWFGKFKTTGETYSPTVLPNQTYVYRVFDFNLGVKYKLSKTLGVRDSRNVGGDQLHDINAVENSHYLDKLSSYMANNNDWGAVVYLSASKYGAGYNKVQMNGQDQNHKYGQYDYVGINGMTGCGPLSSNSTKTYSDGGALGTQQACSISNPQRAYNGSIGKLASTTNNPTGIYDMYGGGAWEYVAASYNSDLNNSATSKGFDYLGSAPAHPPYVNTYNFSNLNSCTFDTCGGQALHETNDGIGNDIGNHMWNNQYMALTKPFDEPWLIRGGSCSDCGLFCLVNSDGRELGARYSFRVVLAPAPYD